VTVACAGAALAGCQFDPSGFSAHDGAGEPTPADAAPDAGSDVPMIDAAPIGFADAAPPTVADAAPPFVCPAGYVADPISGTSYRLSALPASWRSAEADCENDDAHLAIVSDQHEIAHVDAMAAGSPVWVGLSDSLDEGIFLWVDGLDASFQPWHFGEPNDGGLFGEDCVSLAQGGYNDEGCIATLHRYVCECDGLPADPASF
jgi:hypothetical protein